LERERQKERERQTEEDRKTARRIKTNIKKREVKLLDAHRKLENKIIRRKKPKEKSCCHSNKK
jgi:hypothetical protein